MYAYFPRLAARQKRLEEHGLSSTPTEEELVDCILDLSDRVEALYDTLGLVAFKDRRGTYHALGIAEEGAPHA